MSKVCFNKNIPVGRNFTCKYTKEAAMDLGFEDYLAFNGHCLRKYNITTMVNAPNVKMREIMHAARHTSVSQHKNYIEENVDAQYEYFKAVGLVPSTTT